MPPPAGRRLTLSPIGFDVVLALSQAPDGLRLADIGRVIGSPMSSTQTALRILVANDIVRRGDEDPPRYKLSDDHPARSELVSLAAVLPDPPHAIGLILRANPAVKYAAVDDDGFIASQTRNAPPGAVGALDVALDTVASARTNAPEVVRVGEEELERHVRIAIGLRSRAEHAVTIKGKPPGGARGRDVRGIRAIG